MIFFKAVKITEFSITLNKGTANNHGKIFTIVSEGVEGF
jgi:hypothetical protein